MGKQKHVDPHRNIRFLLENWQYLYLHCTDAITSDNELDPADQQILNRYHKLIDNVKVRVLAVERHKTQIFLSHAEHQFILWRKSCSGDPAGRLRRRIIRDLYWQNPRKSLKEIAAEENKPIHAISQQRDIAFHQLSAMIFGADGLLKLGAVWDDILEARPLPQRSGGSL